LVPGNLVEQIFQRSFLKLPEGIKEKKLGDLTPTRDFTFVIDTSKGFPIIAECDETIGKEINVASNYEISMAYVLSLIRETMQSDV